MCHFNRCIHCLAVNIILPVCVNVIDIESDSCHSRTTPTVKPVPTQVPTQPPSWWNSLSTGSADVTSCLYAQWRETSNREISRLWWLCAASADYSWYSIVCEEPAVKASNNTVTGEVKTANSVWLPWLPVRSTDILQPLTETVFIFQRIATTK